MDREPLKAVGGRGGGGLGALGPALRLVCGVAGAELVLVGAAAGDTLGER